MEGPFDVWKIGPGAVALMGVFYTQNQLLQIAKYPMRYICLDSEPAAQIVANKLCNDLMAFPGQTKNIILDSGKDPGNASEKELDELKSLLQ